MQHEANSSEIYGKMKTADILTEFRAAREALGNPHPLLNDPEKYKAFVSRIPLGRWGELPEIIVPAVFLASDASSYMTGAALYVDGGWTAQ